MTHRIAIVIFPGFQILDATGPLAAFEIAARYAEGFYALSVRAAEAGAVASSAGPAMLAEPLGDAGAADTVLVAGGDGSRAAMRDEALLAHVRAARADGRRIASVCSGAYVLAAAGLLDGRRATTHWSRTADFARRFPRVRLRTDSIWTHDDGIWTSAGITAGIDLALAIIAHDVGEGVARDTARQLVVAHRRAGGQSQFSALADTAPESRFAALLAWARANLVQPLDVEQLADRAAMSPRNFARAFAADQGVTPAKAIERLRLEAARARLEGSGEAMETIARATGFGDAERMRRAFIRAHGHPPQALRRAASGAPAAQVL